MRWTPEVGQFVKTPEGVGMIVETDQRRQCVVVEVNLPTTSPVPCQVRVTLDESLLVDSDLIEGDLSDPVMAERYLNGEPAVPALAPIAARDLPCASICQCTWCYRISSNGFHMCNRGQCRCETKNCPCLTGSR